MAGERVGVSRTGEKAIMPPDPVGRKTRRVEGVIALPDSRAGFEPFRGRGIPDALPNLTRAAAKTGVSHNHSVMPHARNGSKPARDNLNG